MPDVAPAMDHEKLVEEWVIAAGDGYTFEIEKARPRGFGELSTHGDLNGYYPTRLAAIEGAIRHLEADRTALAKELARAKRMRRYAIRQQLGAPDEER